MGKEPPLTLTIDPERPSITLQGPIGDREAAPRSRLEHLSVRPSPRDPGLLQVVITDPSLFVDAYPVLCAIADRAQLDGNGFGVAVTDTLRLLIRLTERNRSISRDREVGLVGELLTLIGACKRLGPQAAVSAWRGPHGEEHDFAIEDLDVEVKTTASERRAHWIGSLTQLQATPPAPLWLVSHQLTEAGRGQGWTLGELVAAARGAAAGPTASMELDAKLAAAGWAEPFDELCVTRWRRRSPSRAFLVAEDFPRLTAHQLADTGFDYSHVTDVRYRIDLTQHEAGAMVPEPLADIIATEVNS
ncbi:PD-(D/E)XK motif protein [Micromonospora sp. R77]|uniref:PD-(D/E)XK motif protein n=1 Tax=Micromonospora sp. R77 TaxID=2925836 RepID=UPI001F625117|nr:PD-(D/E)XK motif protein [Micromonospora sp. R77]MCI4064498.1 PD-(D/E)XK motif protein [Micromonospora sp. R77]